MKKGAGEYGRKGGGCQKGTIPVVLEGLILVLEKVNAESLLLNSTTFVFSIFITLVF